MPKEGYVAPTFDEKKWNSLKYHAKIRGIKSVQQMIYKDYNLG